MQTLTYGLKKPTTGDTGATVFPAMEGNITQLDAHNHNGTNSPKLTAGASVALTATLLAASWIATSNGNYRQAVTLPASLSYDTTKISTRVADVEVVAKIEKISSSQYYVYSNDNTVDFLAVYTT